MKRAMLLYFIYCLLVSCVNQNKTSLTALGQKEGKYYDIRQGTLYTGLVFIGKQKCGFIENGLIEGKWIEYDLVYDSKSLESFYLKGVKDGAEISYCPDGSKSRESVYINGLKEGKEMLYSCTKSKLIETVEYKKDVVHGKRISYYEYPSKIKEIVEYKEGVIDGLLTRFNEKETIIETMEFKDGKLDGQWIIYDDRKNIVSKEIYHKGNLLTKKISE